MSPIFLPMPPEMKPRMLWACHWVESAISWRLAPSARRISSSTMAFLLPSRVVGAASILLMSSNCAIYAESVY